MSRRPSERIAYPIATGDERRRTGDEATSTRLPLMGTVMTLSGITIEHRDAFELRAADGWHVTVASRLAAVRLASIYQWKLRSAPDSLETDTHFTMSGASPPRGSRA